MDDFEQDREILKEAALLDKIKNHLIRNVGVDEKNAKRDAESMVTGRKKVKEWRICNFRLR